jgi:hypothetical protein
MNNYSIINKKYINWAIVSLLLFLLVFKFFNLFFGIDSIWDEGYLLLNYSKGIDANEISQYPLFVSLVIGNKISILELKFFKFFLQIISCLFFFYALVRKQNNYNSLNSMNQFELLIIVVILYLPSFDIYTSIISYNHLQQFFFSIVISLLIILDSDNFLIQKKLIVYFVISHFLIWAILNIVSSGILLLFLLIIFILFYIKENKMISLIVLAVMLILNLLIFHFFLLNLRLWSDACVTNVLNLSNSNRGYDPNSMLHLVVSYFFYFIKLLISSGLIYVSILFLDGKKFVLQLIVTLVICFVFFAFNQVLALFFAPFFFILFQKDVYKNYTYILFLLVIFFIPLVMSIGTNTSLINKSLYFTPIWVIPILTLNNFNLKFRKISFFILVIATLFNQYLWINNTKYSNGNIFSSQINPVGLSKLRYIHIRKKQQLYFSNIKNILNKYDLENPLCFSFQLDHTTVFILNGRMQELFFDVSGFVSFKKKLNPPDLIFLTKWEYKESYDKISKMGWRLKDDYDSIFVSSPEDFEANYSLERSLFIRKKVNNINSK